MEPGHPDRMMLALLAALALLVPVASAASVHADVQTDRMQGQGIVNGDGALTALLYPTPSSNRASLPGFDLTAKHLRIETDYAEVAVVVPDAFNSQPLAETRVDYHTEASLSSGNIQEGYRFNVIPTTGRHTQVALDASCAAAEPPGQDQFTHEAFVQIERDRPDTVIDASDAVQWTTCASHSTATITGDFWFSAWAIDFTVQDADGMHSYWSGHRDDQVVTQDQELYVFVTNGTLRIPLGTGGHALLVGAGSTLNVEGSLQLSNAHGTLTTPAGSVELGGRSVTVDGALHVQADHVDGALKASLGGDARSAVINGDAIAFPGPKGILGTSLGIASILSLLVAVAVVAWYASTEVHFRRLAGQGHVSWAYAGRRRRGVVYADRAQRAAKKGHPRRTWLWASLALRSQKERALLLALRAEAKARIGRHKAALRDHEGLHGVLQDKRRRAQNACLAARNAAHVHDTHATKIWMERALELNDMVFLVESIDIAYDDLRSHGWFKHLMRRAETQVQGFQ